MGLARANCSDESAMVRLPFYHSADRLPIFFCHCPLSVSLDQLDKADARRCVYLLGVQYLVSPSDDLAGYAFTFYKTLAVQKPPADSTEPVHALGPLDLMTLSETETTCAGSHTVRAMLNEAGSRLSPFDALSFLLITYFRPDLR